MKCVNEGHTRLHNSSCDNAQRERSEMKKLGGPVGM